MSWFTPKYNKVHSQNREEKEEEIFDRWEYGEIVFVKLDKIQNLRNRKKLRNNVRKTLIMVSNV